MCGRVEVEAQMTDGERFSLLVSVAGSSTVAPSHDKRFPDDVTMCTSYAPGVPRLGVPALLTSDSSMGIVNLDFRPGDTATALPASVVLASSFNPELARAGGLLVALAALRGAQVIGTAGPASRQRVGALGAGHVIDYRDQDWPGRVRATTGGHGVAAAASAVPGGAASAIRAVADGGRLAAITSDPPGEQRGITVSSLYVRADGSQLRELARQFGDGQLEIPVAARYRLADTARALAPGDRRPRRRSDRPHALTSFACGDRGDVRGR